MCTLLHMNPLQRIVIMCFRSMILDCFWLFELLELMQCIIRYRDVLIKSRMICMVVSRNSNSSGRYICESLKKLVLKSKMNYIKVGVWTTKINTAHFSSCHLKAGAKNNARPVNLTHHILFNTYIDSLHLHQRNITVLFSDNATTPIHTFHPTQHSASIWKMMKCRSPVNHHSHQLFVLVMCITQLRFWKINMRFKLSVVRLHSRRLSETSKTGSTVHVTGFYSV